MACKLTFKGKRYNSLSELKSSREYKSALASEGLFNQQESVDPENFEPALKENPVDIGARRAKDQLKANYADGIIGYGTHSTGKYAKAFGGTRTSFSPGETIMISVNGENRPNQKESVERTKQAIDLAISQGVAAFIADNERDANSSHNYVGEGKIRKYLLSKGLIYKEFKGVGLYVTGGKSSQEAPTQKPVQPEEEPKGMSAVVSRIFDLVEGESSPEDVRNIIKAMKEKGVSPREFIGALTGIDNMGGREDFHMAMRILSEDSRYVAVMNSALKKYGAPTLDELTAFSRDNPDLGKLSGSELSMLVLEGKMHEDYIKYKSGKIEKPKGMLGRAFVMLEQMADVAKNHGDKVATALSTVVDEAEQTEKPKFSILTKARREPVSPLLKSTMKYGAPITREESDNLIVQIAHLMISKIEDRVSEEGFKNKGSYDTFFQRMLVESIREVRERYSWEDIRDADGNLIQEGWKAKLERKYGRRPKKEDMSRATEIMDRIIRMERALPSEAIHVRGTRLALPEGADRTLINNLKTIQKEVAKYASLHLSRISDMENLMEAEEKEDEQGQRWNISQYEEGGYQRISERLKALINRATLFVDEFGLGDALEEGMSLQEISTMERYQKPINPISVYNSIIKVLSDTKKADMMAKLRDYTEYSNNPETKKFLRFLAETVAEEVNSRVVNKITFQDVIDADEEFSMFLADNSPSLSLLMRAGHGTRLEAWDVLLDSTKGIYKVVNSAKRDIEVAQVATWKAQLEASGVGIKKFTDTLALIREKMDDVFTKGLNVSPPTKAEFSDYISDIQELLTSVGITVSSSYVKYSVIMNSIKNIDEILKVLEREVEGSPETMETLKEMLEYREYAERYADIPYMSRSDISWIMELSKKAKSPTLTFVEDPSERFETTNRYMKFAEGNAFFDETVSPSSYMNMEDELVQVYSPAFYYSDKISELKDTGDNTLRDIILNTITDLKAKYDSVQDIPQEELEKVLEKLSEYGEANNPIPNNMYAYVTLNILMHDSLFNYSEEGKSKVDVEYLEAAMSHINLIMFGGGRQQSLAEEDGEILEQRRRTEGATFSKLTPADKMLVDMVLYNHTSKKRYNGKDYEFGYVRMNINGDKRRQFATYMPKIKSFVGGKLTKAGRRALRSIIKQEYETIRTLYNVEGIEEVEGINAGKTGRAFEFKRLKFKETESLLEHLKEKATVENVPFEDLNKETIDGLIDVMTDAIMDETVERMEKDLMLIEYNEKLKGYVSKSLPQGYSNREFVDMNAVMDYALGSFINRVSINNLINLAAHFTSYKSPRDEARRGSMGSGQGNDMGSGSTRIMVTESLHKAISEEEGQRHGFFNNGEEIDTEDGISRVTVEWYINTFLKSEGAPVAVGRVLRKMRRGEPMSNFDYEYLLRENAIPQSLKLQINSAYVGIKSSTNILDRAVSSYVREDMKEESKEFFDAWDELEDNFEWDTYQGKNPNYQGFDIEDFKRGSVKFFEPIPGRETLHNLMNGMYLGNFDMAVADSASKKKLPNNATVNIPNTMIRKQVETGGQKYSIPDPTQKRHLIVSEIADRAKIIINGVETHGEDAVNFYKRLLAVRTKMGIEEKKLYLIDMLGFENYREMLGEFASIIERTNQPPYVVEMFSLDELGSMPKYDLNLPSISKKYEAMFLSMYSDGTLRQTAPGTKFTLVPDVGFSKLSYRGGYITTDQFLKLSDEEKAEVTSGESDRLRHRVLYEDGNYYSEAVVSGSFAKAFGLNVGDNIPKELLKFAGVRIPTQDKHSMVNIKVVDIVSASMGNMIVLPYELVGLTGWDFDIDALYARVLKTYRIGTMPPIKYGSYVEFEDIDVAVRQAEEEYLMDLAENNSRVKSYLDRNNLNPRSLADIRKALAHLMSMQETIKKDDIKPFNAAQARINVTAYQLGAIHDITPLTRGEADNLLLKTEIGLLHNDLNKEIAATPATRKDLVRIADIYIRRGIKSEDDIPNAMSPTNVNKLDEENSVGAENIGIAALFNVTLQYIATMTPFGLEKGPNGELFTKDVNGNPVRVNDIMSQLVTAMVDSATHGDPGFFNITKESLGVVGILLGMGHSIDYALHFINQPVIRSYAQKTSNVQGVVAKAKFRKYQIKDIVIKELGLKGEQEDDYNEARLLDNMLTPEDEVQLSVLHRYIEMSELNGDLLSLAQINGTMSKGMGSNLAEAQRIKDAIHKFVNNYPMDSHEILRNNPQLSAQMDAMEAAGEMGERFMLGATRMYNDILDAMRPTLSQIAMNINNGEDRLRNGLTSYLFTKAIAATSIIENNESLLFTKDLHNEIRALKAMPEYEENPLIKYLELSETKFEHGSMAGMTLYNIRVNTRRKEEAKTINRFMDAYSSMYYSGDPTLKKIAIKLKDFLIIRDAFLFKSGTYINSIEPQILKAEGVFDTTRQMFEEFKRLSAMSDKQVDEVFKKLFLTEKGKFVHDFLRMFTRASENRNLLNKIRRTTYLKLKNKKGTLRTFTFGTGIVTMNFPLHKEASKAIGGVFGPSNPEANGGSRVPMGFAIYQGDDARGQGYYILSKVQLEKGGPHYDLNSPTDYMEVTRRFPGGAIYAFKATYHEKPTLGSKEFTPYFFSEDKLNNLSKKYISEAEETSEESLERKEGKVLLPWERKTTRTKPLESGQKTRKSRQAEYRMPMNFADGTGGRKMRPEFKGKSTLQLVKEGKRTATSRDRSKSYNQQDIQVGDIIEFYDKIGNTVKVEVTKAPYGLSEITAEEWSKLEGWSQDMFETLKNKGYEQFQFKLITNVNTVAGTTPTKSSDTLDINNLTPTKDKSWLDALAQEEELSAIIMMAVGKGMLPFKVGKAMEIINSQEFSELIRSDKSDVPLLHKIMDRLTCL